MNISEKDQNTINRNRLAIEQQLQDMESAIAYIRRSFNTESDDYTDEPEMIMGHQATNMMTRVMELGSLIATNAVIIKIVNRQVGE
jgi:hypothetical protein